MKLKFFFYMMFKSFFSSYYKRRLWSGLFNNRIRWDWPGIYLWPSKISEEVWQYIRLCEGTKAPSEHRKFYLFFVVDTKVCYIQVYLYLLCGSAFIIHCYFQLLRQRQPADPNSDFTCCFPRLFQHGNIQRDQVSR